MIDNNFLNVSIGANFGGGASFLHHAEEIVLGFRAENTSPSTAQSFADDVQKRDKVIQLLCTRYR